MNRMLLSESLWPAQTDEPIWETTVGGLLREVAARDPSAPALVEVDVEGETGRRWTYGELLADSERLAHALGTRFSPGERVVVWAPNIPEWVLTEYACALSGLVLVTANPAYQARELRYVLEIPAPWRCSWSRATGAIQWPPSPPRRSKGSPPCAKSST